MQFEEKLSPLEFVMKYCIKNIVCCFSGGKDSLCATHYVLSMLEDVELDRYVLCIDTSVIIPGSIEYVREVANKFGWNLQILNPKKNFFEYVEQWGFPMMHRRWCCYHLKLQPIIEFVKKLAPPKAEVTGLRRAESLRRREIPQIIFGKRSHSWKYAPLFDWTDEMVWNYIREHNLPVNPIYSTPIKETCFCGVFASKRKVKAVRGSYPEFFTQFAQAEKRMKKGGAAFYLNYKPSYANGFLKQKTLNEVLDGEK